ncbi:MAG: hypothetical protein JWR69_2139 [Pedosphaera sp.]|nr:hypothetical protein [Pedosphaera sp.]
MRRNHNEDLLPPPSAMDLDSCSRILFVVTYHRVTKLEQQLHNVHTGVRASA